MGTDIAIFALSCNSIEWRIDVQLHFAMTKLQEAFPYSCLGGEDVGGSSLFVTDAICFFDYYSGSNNQLCVWGEGIRNKMLEFTKSNWTRAVMVSSCSFQ